MDSGQLWNHTERNILQLIKKYSDKSKRSPEYKDYTDLSKVIEKETTISAELCIKTWNDIKQKYYKNRVRKDVICKYLDRNIVLIDSQLTSQELSKPSNYRFLYQDDKLYFTTQTPKNHPKKENPVNKHPTVHINKDMIDELLERKGEKSKEDFDQALSSSIAKILATKSFLLQVPVPPSKLISNNKTNLNTEDRDVENQLTTFNIHANPTPTLINTLSPKPCNSDTSSVDSTKKSIKVSHLIDNFISSRILDPKTKDSKNMGVTIIENLIKARDEPKVYQRRKVPNSVPSNQDTSITNRESSILDIESIVYAEMKKEGEDTNNMTIFYKKLAKHASNMSFEKQQELRSKICVLLVREESLNESGNPNLKKE